jgi:hypothetical protein
MTNSLKYIRDRVATFVNASDEGKAHMHKSVESDLHAAVSAAMGRTGTEPPEISKLHRVFHEAARGIVPVDGA